MSYLSSPQRRIIVEINQSDSLEEKFNEIIRSNLKVGDYVIVRLEESPNKLVVGQIRNLYLGAFDLNYPNNDLFTIYNEEGGVSCNVREFVRRMDDEEVLNYRNFIRDARVKYQAVLVKTIDDKTAIYELNRTIEDDNYIEHRFIAVRTGDNESEVLAADRNKIKLVKQVRGEGHGEYVIGIIHHDFGSGHFDVLKNMGYKLVDRFKGVESKVNIVGEATLHKIISNVASIYRLNPPYNGHKFVFVSMANDFSEDAREVLVFPSDGNKAISGVEIYGSGFEPDGHVGILRRMGYNIK